MSGGISVKIIVKKPCKLVAGLLRVFFGVSKEPRG